MHKLIMGNGVYTHKNHCNYDNRKNNIISVRGNKNNGRTNCNGYIMVYLPEHKRAFDNGCVYEHVLKAEEKLGRELLPDEVVHHIDYQKQNNNLSNLMVFATEADHIKYHSGGSAILQENGSYICKNDINKKYIDINGSKVLLELCQFCNKNYKYTTSKMCCECYNKYKARNIPSKIELQKYIGEIPFTKIGQIFGVTDNTVRKWCKKYALPYRSKDITKLP